MDSSLCHHGILGMKWGRRRYQNKDGSLTPAGKKRYGNDEPDKEPETTEQKRARLLKSTDAKEIYKDRDVLSTSELNERINRIDTERRLSQIAEGTKKSGMDRVNDALKIGRKVNEVYEFTNTPVMKALKKKLAGDVEEHLSPDLQKIWKNRDKLTDNELSRVLKRVNTEKALKKFLDDYEEEQSKKTAKSNAQKQVDDYVNSGAKSDSVKSTTYRMKGDDIPDNKTATGKDSSNRLGIDYVDKVKATADDVVGRGRSSYDRNRRDSIIIDAEEGRDFWSVNDDVRSRKVSDLNDDSSMDSARRYISSIGGSSIAGLLEDKHRGGR